MSRSQLATLLDVNVNTIATWVTRGCPYVQKGHKGKPWLFNVATVVQWKEQQARDSVIGNNDAVDLDEARRRKVSAEAAIAELNLQQLRGELIEVEAVAQAVADEYSNVRQRLLAMPTKLAPQVIPVDSIPEAEALIQEFIHEAIEELTQDGIYSGDAEDASEAEAEGGAQEKSAPASEADRL